MRAPPLLAVLAGLSLLLPTAAAGGGAICGGLAPFITECHSPGPFAWPAGGTVNLDREGFVGTLEASLEWAGGAYRLRCASLAVDALSPVTVWPCETEGRLPAVGTPVRLHCIASEHPDLPLGPAGTFGCRFGVI